MKKFFKGFAAILTAVSIMGNISAIFAEENKADDTDTTARLITYKAPEGVDMNGSYKVKAKPHGTGDDAWQELDVYMVQVMSNGTRNSAMTYFDCTGAVDVRVTVTGGIDYFDDIDEATGQKKGLLAKGTTEKYKPANGAEVDMPIDTRIYPESYGIEPQYEAGGDTVDFTVEPGQRIVLDPNGDTRRNLQIWTDYPIDMPSVEELENDGKTVTVVDAAQGGQLAESYDTDVVYVKPGFYSEGYKETIHYIKSDQTWYIEGGAVIQGTLNMDYTTNASIIGHGLIWRPQYASITVNDAVNARVEGMMGLNHGWHDNGGYFINIANSKSVYVKNLKSIGRHKWGDTMDIFCSEDITVEGCYFRGNDDCIAIYGPRWTGNYWGDTGNVRNIQVKDCVLMPDLARPIHFGTHGDSASPNGGRVIDNCRFENIDILTYNKYAFKTNADGSINRMPQSIRMDVSEGNTVSNIYFNNIRIRDYMANKLCELFITTQDRYGTYTYPGKGINNVYFKDIDYRNIDSTHDGRIEGYKTSDGVDGITQNITFENLKINGKEALSAEDAHLNIGNNTKNIRFVNSGEAVYSYNPSAVPEDIWPEYYDYAQSASAEASENGSDPSYAVDDDENTVWYSQTAKTNPAYADGKLTGNGLTINLGAQRLINGVRITWKDPALTHDYRIYVSKDGQDWSAGHTDEHGIGAVNDKSRAEYNKRVKTTWFVNQYDPNQNQDYIIGQYVKIIPMAGRQLDIVKAEVLGAAAPEAAIAADIEDAAEITTLAAANDGIMPAAAFEAPEPDNGTADGISNGGEWSIYASKIGKITADSGAIEDVTDTDGLVEVTSGKRSAAMRFDLSTKDSNEAANGKVIKSAKLRLTPMVSKSNLQQSVSVVSDEFINTDNEAPAAEFTVPRVGRDNFFDDTTLAATESVTEYPEALKSWQTDIDITGEVISTDDNTLSLHTAYLSGNSNKSEYAACNIAANNRLNGNAIPFLYNNGATDYSKWIYPQIVFEYSDSENYKKAYADFVSVNAALTGKTVTESQALALPSAANGSEVSAELYGDENSPIKVDGGNIVINNKYSGNASCGYVKFTVTRTENGETAEYSRIAVINAEYTKSNTITFSTEKNPLGEISVEAGGTVYTDGTAYAKTGGAFTVNGGANAGYTANITVTADDGREVSANPDGSYTMPDGNVTVNIEYSKSTFGTTRIAAINSMSIKGDGSKQSPDLVIGANRVTFVKFDLSGYSADIISAADMSFTPTKNITPNTKAVFNVPNNNWDENIIDKNFKLDGSGDTDISGFKYTGDDDAEKTISLLNGENHAELIIPDANDASTAANGILKDYYAASTGTQKTCTVGVTDAVKQALKESDDGIVTFMLYSSAGSGNDVYSVNGAPALAQRPSLTIKESAEFLPDNELITEINSEDDMLKFADIVNGGNDYAGKTVTLNKSLDLSDYDWTGIGSQDAGGINPFAGTFDGGGNTVNLNIDATEKSTLGLFGIVTGNISNLTVTGTIKGSSVIGGIAGRCGGSIENCHNEADITARREAGGIVGALSGGGTVSGCDNKGDIKITDKETYAGGIAGHIVDSTVTGCTNEGTIENGTDGFRNRLGGIVGFLDNGTIVSGTNDGAVISNAENSPYTGDISQNYAGGIAGYSSYGTAKDCTNNARVYNAVPYAGGVAGYLMKGGLENCSYDETVNGGLEIVGYNQEGTITSEEKPTPTPTTAPDEPTPTPTTAPDEPTPTPTTAPDNDVVYAEDGIIILATYNQDETLLKVEIKGEVKANEKVKEIPADENQKVFVWNSLNGMKPIATKQIHAD